MSHLEITNQCHENWSDFTPTEQGAFCQKCKTDVKDFSSMSNQDIKDYLDANTNQHLCGRFRKNQIDEFNDDTFLLLNNDRQTVQLKFIFVLLITFGLTLFSCANEAEKKQIEIISEMINLPVKEKFNNNKMTDKIESTDQSKKHQQSITKNNKIYEIPKIDKDSTFCEGTIDNSDEVSIDVVEIAAVHMMGAIAYQPDVEINECFVKDTIQNITQENIHSIQFDSKLFPNPTIDQSNLIINVKQDDFYVVTLMDLNGKVLDEIFQGDLVEGEQQFMINLNDYSNGYYFISIQSQNNNESLKILKTD